MKGRDWNSDRRASGGEREGVLRRELERPGFGEMAGGGTRGDGRGIRRKELWGGGSFGRGSNGCCAWELRGILGLAEEGEGGGGWDWGVCRSGLTENGRAREGVEVRGGEERWKLGSMRG